MIEIHINKDVGSYEAKFIGPFTMRQTFCLCIAAPICWFVYKVASPVMSSDAAGFLLMIPAAVAWIFGWTKPYGMRPEKFIQSVFINMVLAPAIRKYKTEFRANDVVFSAAEKVMELPSDSVITESEPVDEDASQGNTKKNRRRPRYKVSPDAVK